MHNILIYGLLCIKCVKNTKGAIFELLKNFRQQPTRARYTAVYLAMLHCLTSTRPDTRPCARPCLCNRMLRTCIFQVVTITTKATTLVTIRILNYNNYNSYFKHSNNPHLITTLATNNMLKYHIHNSCKYQHA